MATRDSRIGWRTAVLWFLALLFVAFTFIDDQPVEEDSAVVDDSAPGDVLRIVDVKPIEVNPGSSVVVSLEGAEADTAKPLTASIAKREAEVLSRQGDRLVVRIPAELEPGRAKLRVHQGDRRSKPAHVRVNQVQRRKILRNVVGGLALFVLGLSTVGKGLRAYAGQGVREVLGRVTRGSGRAISLGVAVGGITQSMTSSAGLVVGLIDARMLAASAAAAVLLGAQLGASATVAVLPFAATREALLVVAVGVAWVGLAQNRRSKALGRIVLGVGLLFYGLRVLRIGFQPLMADPEILTYLEYLQAGSAGGMIISAAAGALLCGVLQGPGPVFALVLGLAQSSGLLGVEDALTVLAGTSFGAVIGTVAVGWAFGRDGRRLGVAHGLFGLLMTIAVVVTIPLWVALADAIVAGDAAELAYGKKVLMPNVGAHISVAFVASQLAGVLLLAPMLPWIERLAVRVVPGPSRTNGDATGGGESAPRSELVRAVQGCRAAIDAMHEVVHSGQRTPAERAEHALAEVRTLLEGRLAAQANGDDGAGLDDVAVGCLQLQSALDGALRTVERGLSRNVKPTDREREVLDEAHRIVGEGLDTIVDGISGPGEVDLEGAKAREIRLNALEASFRRELVDGLPDAGDAVPLRLLVGDLIAAYEGVGNSLYRVVTSLAASRDDDLG